MQEQPGQRFRGVKLRSAQGVGSRVQEGPGVPFKLHSDVSLLDAPGGCLNGECRPPSSCADETGVLVLGGGTASLQLCRHGAVLAQTCRRRDRKSERLDLMVLLL